MTLALTVDDVQVDQNGYVSIATTVNGNPESLGWGLQDIINAVEDLENSFNHETLLVLLLSVVYKSDNTLANIGDIIGATISINMTSGANVVEVTP